MLLKINKSDPILFLTLAVMRETALGSGRVLGMLLQSCHMNLTKSNIKFYTHHEGISTDYKKTDRSS